MTISNPRPDYTDQNSTQTLRTGLVEYYAVNPQLNERAIAIDV
jgi:hypothetical protein